MNNNPIGVLDSGVGGLTVAKELQEVFPNEEIIYFGDNGNCPYGNRPQEEILELTHNMLRFMEEKKVKVLAVACNTISTLIEEYRTDYTFPIVSIIEPVANKIVADGLKRVGVIATEFTIKQKTYDKLIGAKDPSIEVFGEGSKDLAMLVDRVEFEGDAIPTEVKTHVDALVKGHDLTDIILGCTHFPIVIEEFQKAAPTVNFINPAKEQVTAVKSIVEKNDWLSEEKKGSLTIYTSGSDKVYQLLTQRLGIRNPTIVEVPRTPLENELKLK